MDLSINGVDFKKEMVLSLCKPDRKPFMEIHNVKNLARKISLVGVDELSFDVPLYRPTIRGKKVRNELYDAIVGDFYIYLNDGKDEEDGQYFIVQNPDERKDDNGEVVKSIVAYSSEYAFSSKKVQFFDKIDCLLYDPNYQKDDNGVERGFLNFIENNSTWRVSYVAPKLLHKSRDLKFSDTSFLDAFKTCQEKFNCLFQYDTVKEQIRVITVDDKKNGLGGNQGIVISDNNFVKSIAKKINTDDIVTRLHVYGEDSFSFQDFDILGKPYIEDLSFYRDFNYMSESLKNAFDKKQKVIDELTPDFTKLVNKLNKASVEIGKTQGEWRALQGKLMELNNKIDQDMTEISTPSYGNTILEEAKNERRIALNKNKELKSKAEKDLESATAKLDDLKNQSLSIIKEMNQIRDKVKPSLFFTEDDLREYNRYIKEGVVRDSSFVEEDVTNLRTFAEEELKRVSYPSISFDIDLDDFRSIARFETPMARLKVGDLVNLESDDLNIKFDARLLEMELNYENEGVRLHFGNKFSTTDPTVYLSDLIANIQSASNQVALRDRDWNKSIEQYSSIARRLDSDLDLSKQAIVTAENQHPILDERGLWLTKQNPDGTIDNKQVRAINNVIAFSNDNWETVSTAITGDGINAEAIRGRLGEFVTVNANQIVVNDQTEESQLADFVRANGGKTYRQNTPPDVKNGKVDSTIKIPDGALWLKSTNEDGSGKVVGIYRYNKNKTYSWDGIGSYTGSCHWQEVSDLVYKDKSYGGAKLGDNGLTTTSNGVRIDHNGVTVSNYDRDSGTTVNTEMNAEGFYIKKGVENVFYVNKKGELSIRSPKTRQTITVNDNGITMPATTRLTIGDRGNSYIDISSSGVTFGSNGLKYNTSTGDLTIGGSNGLAYDGWEKKLYIGGQLVATGDQIGSLWNQLMALGKQLDENSRVPAFVQFG